MLFTLTKVSARVAPCASNLYNRTPPKLHFRMGDGQVEVLSSRREVLQ